MWDIEYFCQLCGKWLALNSPSFADPNQAILTAANLWRPNRPTRVVDDWNNIVWPPPGV
jgi:hypothetical protein